MAYQVGVFDSCQHFHSCQIFLGQTRECKRGKYHCTVDLLFDWFGLACFANKNKNCQYSYSFFQTSQTGGQLYSDTFPFSIPWLDSYLTWLRTIYQACLQILDQYHVTIQINYRYLLSPNTQILIQQNSPYFQTFALHPFNCKILDFPNPSFAAWHLNIFCK